MKKLPLGILAAYALAGPAWAADPATIDWNQVPSRSITLFYPGQSSFQWLRSSGHPGAGMVQGGGACLTCHKSQEAKLGEKIVKGGPLEPTPVEGKNGVIPLSLQIAYDN
ncbi:MAG TPA: hypothetical protein VFO02_06045, partial [Burkholderiales bacterium]|nr:hypothetical protein [Burkholderiales bacterium]